MVNRAIFEAVQERSVENSMKEILLEVGLTGAGSEFLDTPRRWTSFLAEYLQPYNAGEILRSGLTKLYDEPIQSSIDTHEYDRAMIVQSGIPYQAVCAHHLLPVLGRAHVGYIPDLYVVGLSKLTRLVWAVTHEKPSLQETVGHTIVRHMNAVVEPYGAMCVIRAEHGCMACRGVAELDVATATAALSGVFRSRYEAREEFYKLAGI